MYPDIKMVRTYRLTPTPYNGHNILHERGPYFFWALVGRVTPKTLNIIQLFSFVCTQLTKSGPRTKLYYRIGCPHKRISPIVAGTQRPTTEN